jgi:hypothetical protein
VFFNRLFSRGEYESVGESMRRAHSMWLTRAFRGIGRNGRKAKRPPLPRIPTAPLTDAGGGFGPMMATPEGREWAREWWESTLDRDDLE